MDKPFPSLPDGDHWVIQVKDYVCYVSAEEMSKIVIQYEEGLALLRFFDIHGSFNIVPRTHFYGLWHSTIEIRNKIDWYQEWIVSQRIYDTSRSPTREWE